MATTKKHHFYVLVMTTDGPKFVTEVNRGDRVAKWEVGKKPLEMSRAWAEDLQQGLIWNFFNAYLVDMPFELEEQPYRYTQGRFEWKQEG